LFINVWEARTNASHGMPYRDTSCYDIKLLFKQLFREVSPTTEIRSLAGDQEFWLNMVYMGPSKSEEYGLAALCSLDFQNLQTVVSMPSSITYSQNGEPKLQGHPRTERPVDPWSKDSRDAVLDWQVRRVKGDNTAVSDFLNNFCGDHV
jgi:hypothetical protein